MAEKVPLPHWVHWVMLVPPVPARKVPATHAVHTEEPADVEKVPAAQVWQLVAEVAPGLPENEPAAQATQVELAVIVL